MHQFLSNSRHIKNHRFLDLALKTQEILLPMAALALGDHRTGGFDDPRYVPLCRGSGLSPSQSDPEACSLGVPGNHSALAGLHGNLELTRAVLEDATFLDADFDLHRPLMGRTSSSSRAAALFSSWHLGRSALHRVVPARCTGTCNGRFVEASSFLAEGALWRSTGRFVLPATGWARSMLST